MTYFVELIEQPGVYLVYDHGQYIGEIQGCESDWRWRLYGLEPENACSLWRAKEEVRKRVSDGGVWAEFMAAPQEE